MTWESNKIHKTLDMDPNFALAHYRLGQIFILKGMNQEAIPELEKAVALSGGGPRATAELALAHAQSGNKKQALKLLDDLKQRSKQRYVSPFNLALIYGAVGDKNQALEWLEKAHEQRSPSLILLNLSPAFKGLRAEPRFIELVHSVGLPARKCKTGQPVLQKTDDIICGGTSKKDGTSANCCRIKQ